MGIYYVNGITTATAATDAVAICAIWNPHATKRIKVHEFGMFAIAAPGAGAGFEVRRITARGTSSANSTPVIANDDNRDIAPPSGFILDLGYSGQPTTEVPAFAAFVFAAVAASGIVMPLRGISIPAGAGLALVNRAAIVMPASEVYFVVED